MPRLPPSRTAIALLALALALISCGGGGDEDGVTPGASPTPPATPAPPFQPAPAPLVWTDDGCVNCHGADGGGGGGGPSVQCVSFDRLDTHIRNDTTSHVGGAFPAFADSVLLDLVAFLRTADCPGGAPADPTNPPPTNGIPSTHTKSEDGVLHHPDYETNLATCTTCHGASLEGTNFAPSCASCHSGDDLDDD